MRFLIDNQLPNALAVWIRSQGHEAQHVLDVQLGQAKDNPVWKYAEDQGQVIVTKDEDFAEWVRRGRRGPQVVWVRLGNSPTSLLLKWLEPLFPRVIQKLEEGERLIELR